MNNNELILSEHPYITFDGEKVDCPPGFVIEDLRERVRTSCEVLAFDTNHRVLAVLKSKRGAWAEDGKLCYVETGSSRAWAFSNLHGLLSAPMPVEANQTFVIHASTDTRMPTYFDEVAPHAYRPGPKPNTRHHKPKNHKRRK